METNSILIIFLIIVILIMLFRTHVTIIDPQPVPVPVPVRPIGGCAGTRYGCCPNGLTPRFDEVGSNC